MHRAREYFTAIIPSFLVDSSSKSEPAIRPTAWLDGIRGWASLIVFSFHFTHAYHTWSSFGYGDAGNWNLLQLPFIRLFYSGDAMVCVFFVVSGYSLAWGPLKELQDGSQQRCLSRLASSTLRRPIRIFGPPIIGSFIVLLCVRLGFFTPSNGTYPGWIHFGYPEYRPPIFETTLEQLQHWYQTTSVLVWVFTFNMYYDYPYDGHLWTIPVEFRYSLIVFLLVLGVSKTRLLYRIILLALSVAYCVWAVSWEGTLFISGVILAQITLIRESHNRRDEPWDDEAGDFLFSNKNSAARSKKRRNFTTIALFAFGLYLASVPDWNQETAPGYSFLHEYFTPPFWQGERRRFLKIIASVLIVYTVSDSPSLQAFFKTSLSRYIGRISFSLYLVHGPVCHMIGHTIIPKFWAMTGGPTQALPIPGVPESDNPSRPFEGGTTFGYEFGIILGALIVVPYAIWIADVFCRFIDEPCVRFAKSFERFLSDE